MLNFAETFKTSLAKQAGIEFLKYFTRLLMNNFNKDIMIGLMFITGIWSFISGQFIFSTLLFAGAAVFSNIALSTKLNS